MNGLRAIANSLAEALAQGPKVSDYEAPYQLLLTKIEAVWDGEDLPAMGKSTKDTGWQKDHAGLKKLLASIDREAELLAEDGGQ